jgi:hypothetical protein
LHHNPAVFSSPDYLEEFVRTWSLRKNVRKIWFSLFTPQEGEFSPERLTADSRAVAIDRIAVFRDQYPKLYAPDTLLDGYRHPPAAPKECIFAQVTACLSADLVTQVTPCQIGGSPQCRECGCIASAVLASIGNFKLAGLVKLSDIFAVSRRVGARLRA